MRSESISAGLPHKAAEAVAMLEEAPKSQACRAGWLALGHWAERVSGATVDEMVRHLLGALELPGAMARRPSSPVSNEAPTTSTRAISSSRRARSSTRCSSAVGAPGAHRERGGWGGGERARVTLGRSPLLGPRRPR